MSNSSKSGFFNDVIKTLPKNIPFRVVDLDDGRELGFYKHDFSERLPEHWTFVFGSDISGGNKTPHAQRACEQYNRPSRIGRGIFTGPDYCTYMIPIRHYVTQQLLPIPVMKKFIDQFVHYTLDNDELFYVSPMTLDADHYSPEDIAPLFAQANRCLFPECWLNPIVTANKGKMNVHDLSPLTSEHRIQQ